MVELWYLWIVAGMGLAILELFLPGYIFVGSAIGAVVTGLLLWLGIWPAGWMAEGLANALLVFALVSLAVWLGLRRTLGLRKGQVKVWTRDINED